MILTNEKNWDDWGIKEEAHKFFLIRWHEIFNEYTYDSWQVRTSNIKSILEEILAHIEVVEEVHDSHPNIKSLIDEAKHTAKTDIIIRKYFIFMNQYLNELDRLYENSIRNFEKRDLISYRSCLKIIIDYLIDYKKKLFDEIYQMLNNPPAKFKNDLYALTMTLGVELKISGYSLKALRNSYNLLINHKNGSFIRRFELLLEHFNGKPYKYNCSFFVNWSSLLPDLNLTGLEVPKIISNENNDCEVEKFLEQDSEAKIASIEVEAMDPFSARDIAENKLDELFSIQKLYQITKVARIKHPYSLIKREDNEIICVPFDTSRHKYLRDSKNIAQRIISFTDFFRKLDDHSAIQISNALKYHKLALSTISDEARLVNLWIALESLLLDGEKAIIQRICKYVPKINSGRYLHSVLTALAIDLRKIWRIKDTKNILKYLEFSNEEMLHVEDFLKILLDKKSGKILKEFNRLIRDQSLLIYRIFRIRDNLLVDPKVFRKSLENHTNNIEWQIRRIYRARNFVIHKGVSPPGTRHLIQHLHSYFIITIHSLFYDLQRNDSWNIRAAFEHRRQLYDHLIFKLKDYNNQQVCAKELLDPEKCLFPISGPPAWPKVENKDN